MEQMRAVVVQPNVAGRLAVQPCPAPSPLPSETLVRVAVVSLNLGEVRRSRTADAGWRPGRDLAGVGQQAAADGSGPLFKRQIAGKAVLLA